MTRCLALGLSVLVFVSSAPSSAWASEGTSSNPKPVSIETNFRGVGDERKRRVEPVLERRARESLLLSGVAVDDHAETVMIFHVRSLTEEPDSAAAVGDYGTHIEVLVGGERVGEPVVTFCDQKGEAELVECTLEGLEGALALLPREEVSDPEPESGPIPPVGKGDADPREGARPGMPFVVGGAVAMVLGAGALTAGAVLHGRTKREQNIGPSEGPGWTEDRQSSGLTVSLMVAGSLVFVGGIALVAVGAQKNKKDKQRRTSVAPSFAPGFAGFSLQGRF